MGAPLPTEFSVVFFCDLHQATEMLHLLLKLLDAFVELLPGLLIGHEGLLQFIDEAILCLLGAVELLLGVELLAEVLVRHLDVLLCTYHDLTLTHCQGVLGLGDLILPLIKHLLPHGSVHLMGGQLLFAAVDPDELGLLLLNLYLTRSQLYCEIEVPHGFIIDIPVNHRHLLLVLLVLFLSNPNACKEDFLSFCKLAACSSRAASCTL